MAVIKNMFHVLNSLMGMIISVVGDKPLYNETFLNKVKSDKDRKDLQDAIDKLRKHKGEGSSKVVLSGEEYTIVVK